MGPTLARALRPAPARACARAGACADARAGPREPRQLVGDEAPAGVGEDGDTTKLTEGGFEQTSFQLDAGGVTLRAGMLGLLTTLFSLHTISLARARHPGERRTFRFEYVTVTLLEEVCKFCIASISFCHQLAFGKIQRDLSRNVLGVDSLLYGVPGLLYCFDNNFKYVILRYLNAAELVLLWNFKIVATVLLLRVFLQKRYGRHQWAAVAALVLGCLLTQATDVQGISETVAHTRGTAKLFGALLAVVGSTIVAFANVFCEWVMKRKQKDSIQFQSMQLYAFGILLNMATLGTKAFAGTHSPVQGPHGFFTGYTVWVALMIVLGSACGLAISAALKFVDNIVVIFAHVLSILIVVLASATLLGAGLSPSFAAGGALVVASSVAFHWPRRWWPPGGHDVVNGAIDPVNAARLGQVEATTFGFASVDYDDGSEEEKIPLTPVVAARPGKVEAAMFGLASVDHDDVGEDE